MSFCALWIYSYEVKVFPIYVRVENSTNFVKVNTSKINQNTLITKIKKHMQENVKKTIKQNF